MREGRLGAHSEALGPSLAGYLLPTAPGDALRLATWLVASDGRLSMERRFQLVRDHDGATMLRGRWDLVCIEPSSGPRAPHAARVLRHLPGGAGAGGLTSAVTLALPTSVQGLMLSLGLIAAIHFWRTR